MIHITRHARCPEFLMPVKAKPTQLAYQKSRPILWAMQNEKCCYCEGHVPEVGHGAGVEHFRPKGIPSYQHLTNHWSNLLLACDACNGKKLNEFPLDGAGAALLLDPTNSALDPENHVEYFVELTDRSLLGQIKPRAGDLKGKITIDTIGLDSQFHLKNRKRSIQEALKEVVNYLLSSGAVQEAARLKLKSLAEGTSEHNGIIRHLARSQAISLV